MNLIPYLILAYYLLPILGASVMIVLDLDITDEPLVLLDLTEVEE